MELITPKPMVRSHPFPLTTLKECQRRHEENHRWRQVLVMPYFLQISAFVCTKGESVKLSNELLELPTHVLEIIDQSSLSKEEKKLVAQIMHNYYVRGLLWFDEHEEYYSRHGVTDSTIAVTELIVLTNCLRKIQQYKGSEMSSQA